MLQEDGKAYPSLTVATGELPSGRVSYAIALALHDG
jgi:hypothetical protein